MANATSFFLTLFLCAVTFFLGRVVRSAMGERVVEETEGLYLQPLWKYLTRDSDLVSPVVNSAVFPGAISLVFYYFSCLPGMFLDLIDNQKLNSLFKIQPEKKPVVGSYKKTLLYTLRNNILFILPGIIFQVVMHGPWLYLQPRCLVLLLWLRSVSTVCSKLEAVLLWLVHIVGNIRCHVSLLASSASYIPSIV